MTLGIVASSNDAEVLSNAFRLASFSLAAGDSVTVFLLGAGVELEQVSQEVFRPLEKAMAFLQNGGDILACGTCLEHRGLGLSPAYHVSDLKALRDLVMHSNRCLTF